MLLEMWSGAGIMVLGVIIGTAVAWSSADKSKEDGK